ncbi:PTS glucose transporter subunit IIA, partial [Lentibacillus halophilus]
FGFKEEMVHKLYGDSPESSSKPKATNESSQRETMDISSPLSGDVHQLSELNDDVFATELVGKGIAIDSSEGTLYAPLNGTITTVYPTGHAIGMTSDSGVEVLMHIGLDTVEIKEKLFELHVETDETVQKGQRLCEFDIDAIKAKGYHLSSPIVVTNSNDYDTIESTYQQQIKAGDPLLTVSNNS